MVIPAYNVGPYIGHAIQSVLDQTRPADEIIVIDDGSSDHTPNEIQKFGSAVRYLRQNNAGASAARNAGIQAASHEWIAFLDGDDQWLPEHLNNHQKLLDNFPDLKWTSAAFFVCLCENPDICQQNRSQLLSRPKQPPTGHTSNFFEAYAKASYGHTATMLIHKSLFQQAGLFDESLARHNDLDMWFRLAYHSPIFGFSDQISAIYHRGIPNSIIKTQVRLQSLFDILDKHVTLSQEHQNFDEFKRCGRTMISEWLKFYLRENNGHNMRIILDRYKIWLPGYNYWTNRISSYLPRTARLYYKVKSILKGRHVCTA